MKKYVADFETTVEENQSRVWAYATSEIGNVENFEYGNNIEDFMKWCRKSNRVVYFHNLKFDGMFLLDYLLKNGFRHSDVKEDNTFNVIITGNQFYQIEVIFQKKNKKYKKVTFLDSYKKLPFKVEKIAKDFGLSIQKIKEFDYKTIRPVGHVLTEEELLYIKYDVQIVAIALGIQLDQGLTRMTTGADALGSFKEIYGKENFRRDFPVLPLRIDKSLRRAYKGGFTYLNKWWAEKDVGRGIVFDVNSLYPFVMYSKMLPYSYPILFEGKYESDEIYPLYIQQLKCTFKLKPNKIPTIQLKNTLAFIPTEYIEDSGVEPVTMTLTNIDLDLFFEHYDVFVWEWIDGWKFKGYTGFFTEYIDRWMEVKENSEGAIRLLAKLMLNSLYGKFCTNPEIENSKYPYLDEKGVVCFSNKEKEEREPIFTALGAFVTSYARELTIRTAQSVYHRFIYADTDSIHLEGDELPDILIHNTKMGAWKHEGTFLRARFLRAKTYVEEIYHKKVWSDKDNEMVTVNANQDDYEFTKLHVTCAGMPDEVKEKVTWDNFKVGFEESGKLLPKRVSGGVVLKDTEFTIKPLLKSS